MKIHKNSKLTPSEIVEIILDKKAKTTAAGHKKIKGVPNTRDPWNNGKNTNVAWFLLDEVYMWTLTNSSDHDQTYREVADDVIGYKPTNKKSWQKALQWVKDNGDPRNNERWRAWRDSHDMEKFLRG